jgi:hypothetical protein
MKIHDIGGASRTKKRFTTHKNVTHPRDADLVNRNFTASCPNAL